MKQYNGEKAIISLTSWKKRIDNVSKTIFSLLLKCPGFHIVLVLSEEEFPKKEEELPEDLIKIIKKNLIEILWVYKNYKVFKKILFTLDKYRDVPVISADDGCIYTENFAQDLYDLYLKNKDCIISKTHFQRKIEGLTFDAGAGGRGVLYPPYCFKEYGIYELSDDILKTNNDDAYYSCIAKKMNIKYKFIDKLNKRNNNFICFDSDENVGLTKNKMFNSVESFTFIAKKVGMLL